MAFAALAEFFPPTGDDWAWGSSMGTKRLSDWFAGFNGRYSGNVLIVALTRTGPVAALVVSAIVCATLVLALHLARSRTPLGYGIAGALFLAMPLGIWRQGVVWLSGFANYAMSAVFLLGFLALADAEWRGSLARRSPVRFAFAAVAGFVGAMFMEHVTVCICLLGVLLVACFRFTHRRWPGYTATWTAASFAGAAVMFSNSAYRRAASSGATYQKVQPLHGKHALRNLAVRLLDELPRAAVVDNVVLNIVLALLLVALVATRRRLRTAAGLAVVAMSLGFAALSFGLWYVERHGFHPERIRSLASVDAFLLLASLLVAAFTLLEPGRRRWTVLVSCATLVLLVAPLLVVNPIGPRCFYPSFVVLILLTALIAGAVRERLPALARPAAWIPVHAVAAGLLAFLFVVYVTINHAVGDRLDHIRAAVKAGQTQVEISPLPYTYYLHNGDPYYSVMYTEFELYYGFPADLHLKLEPNMWLRIPGKQKPPPPT